MNNTYFRAGSYFRVPDARKHLIVSVVKSILRVGGYIVLGFVLNSWGGVAAVSVLVFSETLGIIEELV